MNMNKAQSLLLVSVIYVIAMVAGFFSAIWINDIYLRLFFADVVMTVLIWIVSIPLKNVSLYDPYWSLVPWAIATYFLIYAGAYTSIPLMLIYVALSVWSWRLTINWVITFDDIHWEDWRYKNYRNSLHPLIFQGLSFIGLMMMPTVLVYSALLPFLYMLDNVVSSWWSLFGVAVIVLGTTFEFIGDHQMHTFLKLPEHSGVCELGLWKYSRHPNYLGENLVWIGVFLSFIVVSYNTFYIGYGWILILALFEGISIPLMEGRQLKRRGDAYKEYRRTTSRMLILPKRK